MISNSKLKLNYLFRYLYYVMQLGFFWIYYLKTVLKYFTKFEDQIFYIIKFNHIIKIKLKRINIDAFFRWILGKKYIYFIDDITTIKVLLFLMFYNEIKFCFCLHLAMLWRFASNEKKPKICCYFSRLILSCKKDLLVLIGLLVFWI